MEKYFIVKDITIRHNHKRYMPGDKISLSIDDAVRLKHYIVPCEIDIEQNIEQDIVPCEIDIEQDIVPCEFDIEQNIEQDIVPCEFDIEKDISEKKIIKKRSEIK